MSIRSLTIPSLMCVAAIFPTQAFAQAGTRAALTHSGTPIEAIPLTAVGPIDLRLVQAEDQNRASDGLPPRFAIPHLVKITPTTDGLWETLADGSRRWRLRIGAPGALSINLGLARYDMPKGGRLLLYATDGSYSIRPFTEDDVQDHGQLWTPVLLTDEIVVEVTLPAATPDGALVLELTSINYGYRGFGELRGGGDAGPRSGSCNVDVVCPEGALWELEIASVAVISTGGSTFCTGGMVNNTANDLTPYFITALHCGIDSGNAASLVTYWNFQNSVCRPPGGAASGGAGDGSLSQFTTGATWLAANSPSDMTLVRMNSDPDPTWNVAYAGWDRSTGDYAGAIAIHHPNTDEKRISFEYDPTSTTSYLGSTPPGDGTHVRITDWDLGTTEPGSSGSPLFSPAHRFIGQLHGGYASCTSQTSDWYGRFSVSWASAGLATWLDPGSTGATTTETISSAGMSVAPGVDVTHFGNVGGPFTDPTVIYTLTNSSPSPVSYSVALTASFGILLNGGTLPVAGTLPASGGTANITVSLGTPINSLAAGAHVETISFNDLTNATTKTRLHTVEVGQTLISVAPDTGLATGGPLGGPFTGSATYRVTSDRPTPVDVRIETLESWITMNGSAEPLVYTLTGTGDFVDVVVAISASANALGVGVYDGSVSFTNLTSAAGNTSRPIALEVGRMTYAASDVPQAINDNSTITSTIAVADNFCIGDLDVDLDVTHTYIGDLIVEIASPGGTIVRLHDRTGGSANDIITRYDEQGGTLPDGPGTLAGFNGTSAMGTWTLTISDNAGADTGTLNNWSLRMVPTGGQCSVPPAITTPSLPDGYLGTGYGPATLQATDGEAPLTWSLASEGAYIETGLGGNQFAAAGVAQNWNGDDISNAYTLPFAFNYYGVDYTSVWVCSNGFLDFASSAATYSNDDAGLIANPRIAPLWDDLRTDRTGADIFIDASIAGEVTFRWAAVTYSGENPCNFSVTLYDSGTIRFHYGSGNTPTTPTVGMSSGDGVAYTLSSYNNAATLTNANSLEFATVSPMPAGLLLSPTGLLSGTPIEFGVFTPTFRVTDAFGRSDEAPIALTIHELGAVTPIDCDGSGDFDLALDMACFVDALMGTDTIPPGGIARSDLNGDMSTDGLDIQLFVDCAVHGGCP